MLLPVDYCISTDTDSAGRPTPCPTKTDNSAIILPTSAHAEHYATLASFTTDAVGSDAEAVTGNRHRHTSTAKLLDRRQYAECMSLYVAL
jgi:hypothetical protein